MEGSGAVGAQERKTLDPHMKTIKPLFSFFNPLIHDTVLCKTLTLDPLVLIFSITFFKSSSRLTFQSSSLNVCCLGPVTSDFQSCSCFLTNLRFSPYSLLKNGF